MTRAHSPLRAAGERGRLTAGPFVLKAALGCFMVLLGLSPLSATKPTGAAPSTHIAHLAPGTRMELPRLATGAATAYQLDARPGDYVRGQFTVAEGRFDLDLILPDGRHLRRLVSDGEGQASFQFMVVEAPLRLVATSRADGGKATMEITQRLAPPDQKPKARSLLSPAMAALSAELARGGTTEAFWRDVAQRGTPLVEPGSNGQVVLTFLARGARDNVRLVGAPSGDHEWLQRLGTSDVWFKSFEVPADTRLSYKLAPDVPDLPGSARERRMALLATAAADPLNRAPWPADAPDAYNQDSTLELPGAPEQPGLMPRDVPHGSLSQLRLSSAGLGNTRTITLYTPPGFTPGDPRNVLLLVFDARAYLTKVPTPTILDNLIAEGRLPPVIATFVSEIDPPTRSRELPGNDTFADFMAEDVLSLVRQKTGADVPASRTILAGSSYGGLAATTIALRHPERFGNAIALSGSFWWHPPDAPADANEHVARLVAEGPQRKVRFHLSAGLFENAHPDTPGILDTSRHLRDVMRAKGYDVSYREYAGGHDYFVWRGALADGLLALVPRL